MEKKVDPKKKKVQSSDEEHGHIIGPVIPEAIQVASDSKNAEAKMELALNLLVLNRIILHIFKRF